MPQKPRKEDKTHSKSESFDPISYSHQISEILERVKPILETYMRKHDGKEINSNGSSSLQFQNMVLEYWNAAFQNPQKLIDVNLEYLQNMALLWTASAQKLMGEKPDEEPNIDAPNVKSDRRFKDHLWQDSFAFDFIKQSYLLTSSWLQKSVRNTDGLSQKGKDKVDFYTRQFIDAMAPTNFAMTNPEVLRATMDSQGQNLIKGLTNLVEDLERGGGDLEISKTQKSK